MQSACAWRRNCQCGMAVLPGCAALAKQVPSMRPNAVSGVLNVLPSSGSWQAHARSLPISKRVQSGRPDMRPMRHCIAPQPTLYRRSSPCSGAYATRRSAPSQRFSRRWRVCESNSDATARRRHALRWRKVSWQRLEADLHKNLMLAVDKRICCRLRLQSWRRCERSYKNLRKVETNFEPDSRGLCMVWKRFDDKVMEQGYTQQSGGARS
mmetsp:Transcript_78574/g.139416  ORF Transcript_78574/g.139416 Transcript_78574/m.139416 type:complete len:210 (+) Transcript_78574:415-1044(+)